MWLERGTLPGLVLLLAIGSASPTLAEPSSTLTAKVVVAGGSLTEILYALGVEDQIVGVDTTSVWPAAAENKPQIGYIRSLAAEGILSLSPSMVLALDTAGPASTLTLVKAAGVPVRQLPAPQSPQAVTQTIRTLAKWFKRPQQGQALIESLSTGLAQAAVTVAQYPVHPRVMFILAADSQLLAGGQDTAADAMIRLAGGTNVVTYQGYKPLTPEAAAELAPDVIITVDFVLDALGGAQALLSRPALALTPAGQAQRLVSLPADQLLSFGPRLGQTILTLARQLHQP